MSEHEFITLLDTEEMYWYDGAVYRPNGETMLKAWLEMSTEDLEDPKCRGISYRTDYVNQVLNGVKRRTGVPRADLNPPGKLNLKNGILELDTLSFWPHNSQVMHTTMLPIDYDENATCPIFERFLAEILPDPDARETVHRLFGYTLERGNPFQKACMWYGPGGTGKTTLMNVLTEMLGPENISAVPLQDLSDRHFAAAALFGKFANVVDDLPPNPMRFTSVFKELLGGGYMNAEKKYRDPFVFVNTAKLIFATNHLPHVPEDSFAFWRRWILIDFTVNVMDHVDPHMIDKLKRELPGILNWALRGLEALRKAGGFPPSSSADVLAARWHRENNPLRWFVEECIRTAPMSYVEKNELYEAYVAFCEDHGFPPKKREQVARELPS